MRTYAVRAGFAAGVVLAMACWTPARLIAAAPPVCTACTFTGLHMAGADFGNVVYVGTDFSNADLAGASFRGATLIAVIFYGADLGDAALDGAPGSMERFCVGTE